MGSAKKKMKNLKQEEKETSIVCDKCGKNMVLRWGKNGEYLVCSGRPACKNKKNVKVDKDGNISIVEETTHGACPQCGGTLVEKSGSFGRFIACSNYPDCKYTKPFTMGLHCPEEGCTGELVERISKKKKKFYGCSRYPDCDFATGLQPKEGECPACGAPVLFSLQGKDELPAEGLRVEISDNRRRPGGQRGRLSDRPDGRPGPALRDAARLGTPAHKTDCLSELVCSNSLKSQELTNAHGLLKAELRLLGSLIMEAADASAIPGGKALVVDRNRFAEKVTSAILDHPRIRVVREEKTDLPGSGIVIVATGPLTAPALSERIRALTGATNLHFFDADIAHHRRREHRHVACLFRNRYSPGADDYLNCPLTREEYDVFYDALRWPSRVDLKEFEETPYFEGCLPIEVMAERGKQTLLFGPMKPVGLRDERTGSEPYAVVQLRREDAAGSMYNMVGFQTKLTYPEQERVFRLIPALREARFFRYGSIHRNTFINSPSVLARPPAQDGREDFLRGPDHGRGRVHGIDGHGAARGHRGPLLRAGQGVRAARAHHVHRRALPVYRDGEEGFSADEHQLRPPRRVSQAEEGDGGPEGACRASGGGRRRWPKTCGKTK